MTPVQFDFPLALWVGLPLAAALAGAGWWSLKHLPAFRRRILTTLRLLALLALVVLAARPVRLLEDAQDAKRKVVLLLDRSQSMSLREGQVSRFEKMLDLVRNQLLPTLKSAGLPTEAMLFAENAVVADAQAVLAAKPDGEQTDLANAIEQSFSGAPPAAVIALSDGASNRTGANHRALSALLEAGVPFVGIGFGSDQGASTLNMRRLDAPPVVPPKQTFTLGVQMEVSTTQTSPNLDLALYRDGKLLQTRKIPGFAGSRFWLETFPLKEEEEGSHQYLAKLEVPAGSGFIVANGSASADIRVSNEKEFRVLFAQGALTWDFKFIARALEEDSSVKLTGLSRTSEHSIFRQNVEAAGELMNGFPEKLEDIAGFRVVVLSNLKPTDFNTAQQETLARFCRELGGGVLLLGGAGSFGPEWHGSVLEQLLPVKFDPQPGVSGLDQPSHLHVTDAALRQKAFQIGEGANSRSEWDHVPAFSEYGRVLEVKPGATILAEHERDLGPKGKRILMASQRYGAGQSAVICVQNFWRWRMAKDSDPAQFDRFWRQFLRWLGETSRKSYEISFPAQELRPGQDTQFVVEHLPETRETGEPAPESPEYSVEVVGPAGEKVFEQKLHTPVGQSESLHFKGPTDGLYRVSVLGPVNRELASRSVELQSLNLEFQQTARDMENLRQWAAMTRGLALKAEECQNSGVIADILKQVRLAREARKERIPMGLNWAVLGVVLGALSTEWILRRKWSLI